MDVGGLAQSEPNREENLLSEIAVIGAGYVGLVTSACLAKLGHQVVCLEIHPERLAQLRAGRVPIHEPGLAPLITAHFATGRLRFTDDYADAIPKSEFIFIAVNTPPTGDGRADTGFVFRAVESLIPHLRRDAVVITKSTVPVGTGDRIAEALTRGGAQASVVSNPEFLREGSAVADFFSPDRIVVGADDHEAAQRVLRLFENVVARESLVVNRRSAELAKYAANAFLATRISFMNEVAEICDASGADVEEVARIMGSDRRIGPSFLKAGLGWGGSCFPKDVQALAASAADFGQTAGILRAVYGTNHRQRVKAVEMIQRHLPINGEGVVGVLGLAFKPDTDDIRESPGIAMVSRLAASGVTVRAHDPVAMERAAECVPVGALMADPYTVARGADVLVVATEWPEYLEMDWARVRREMATPVVFDGRNALDREYLQALGFVYLSFGRSPRGEGPWGAHPAARLSPELVRAG